MCFCWAPSPEMPAKKETHLQKAHRLQQEVLGLQTAGQMQAIVRGLKKEPQFIPNIFRQLQSSFSGIGKSLEAVEVEEAGGAGGGRAAGRGKGGKRVTLALCDGRADEGDGVAASDGAEGHGEVSGSGDDPDEQTRRLDQVGVETLRDMLSSMERVVSSPAALRALVRRGQRDASKESLIQILTFTTGLQRHSQVNFGPDKLPQLYSELAGLKKNYGRRGMDLPLPPVWADHGVFELLRAPANIKIKHRFQNVEHIVPSHVVSNYSQQKMWIDQNWSDNDACLKCKGGLLNFPIALLFTEERLDHLKHNTPPAKKPRDDQVVPAAAAPAADGAACASRGTPDGAQSDVCLLPPPPLASGAGPVE